MGKGIIVDLGAAFPFFREEELASLEPRAKRSTNRSTAKAGLGATF